MNFIKKIYQFFSENIRIVTTNPENFEVKWTITSSRFRIYSLFMIALLIISFLFAIILKNTLLTDETNLLLTQNEIAKRDKKINDYFQKISSQEIYLNNLKNIISGKDSGDSLIMDVPENANFEIPNEDLEYTENEKKIFDKVKENTIKEFQEAVLFEPLKAKVVEKFTKNRGFLALALTKNEKIYLNNPGIVIFISSQPKKGDVVIIEHENGFKSIISNIDLMGIKAGKKMKKGEKLGVLHVNSTKIKIELWKQGKRINPLKYLQLN